MVLLLWFYVTGMMLLLGAEVNAVIDGASGPPRLVGTKATSSRPTTA